MTRKKKRHSTLRRQTTQPQNQTPKPREAHPSRGERLARARRQKQRKQRWTTGLIVAVAVVVVGALIWLSNRPLPLTKVEAVVPPGADGTAWGPADAPVVLEEWSDFQ